MAISKLMASKKAGNVPMGSKKWKITRGEPSQDFRVPMPAGAREIGREEEGRLIASGWRAGAMASAATKKVGSAPPVSSAGSAKSGPKPSTTPARNERAKATTVASSAPAGHSATKMHTPSTEKVASTGPSPAASTGRLTLPKDTSGGDAGSKRNLVGLGIAAGAAYVARKPLVGTVKLAGKAAKAIAWTLPKAVAGKVTPKTTVQKRAAALTAQPSGGAGTGRPAVGAPAKAVVPKAATGASLPAATTKPQRGASLTTPKPAASGSATTPPAITPIANSKPKGVAVPAFDKEKAIAAEVEKVRAEKRTGTAIGAQAEAAKEGRVQSIIKQEEAKRAAPRSATSAPVPRMPAQGGSFTNETLDAAFRKIGAAPRPPKGAAVPRVNVEFTPEGNANAKAIGEKIVASQRSAPATKGPISAGLLESAGLTPATATPQVKTPSGQTVVLRKGTGKRKATPASGQPVNTQHGTRQEAQRAVADEAASVTKASLQGDVERTKNPPPPKPKTEADISREFGKASEYQGMREHVVRREMDALAQAATKARADKVTPPKPTTPTPHAGQKATIGDIVPPAIREQLEASRKVQARQEVPQGQTEFETPKDIAKRTKKAEKVKRLQQAQVGSTARVDVDAPARAARKAAIEKHMAEKGFTKVATPTPEEVVEKARPAATKVGPQEAQASSAPPAPKGKPGRFTLAAQPKAAVARARSRGGKAPRGAKIPKLGLLGGALVGAAMAESARAAAPGQKLAAAAKTGGRDLLTMAGLGAATAAVPAVAPVITGYAAYQTARALPQIGRDVFTAAKEGLKAGSAFYEAYKNRKASEAKYGTVGAATATRRQKQGLLPGVGSPKGRIGGGRR